MVRALLLIAAAVLPYLPSLYGTPIYDDVALMNNGWIQRGQWSEWLKRRQNWRQLTYLSFIANVKFFGPLHAQSTRKNLFGFHAVNILLHAINCFVLWWALAQFGFKAAFASSLIFAVHPLCSQGVAYISGRFSVLAATFGFLGLGLMGADHAILATVAIGIACTAKEDAAALFPLASFAGALFGREWAFLPVLASACLAVWYRKPALVLMRDTGSTYQDDAGFPPMLRTPRYQMTAFTDHLLKLPFWIVGFKQSAKHALPVLTHWKVFGAFLLADAMVFFAWGHPLYMLALALFFVPLAPYLIIPIPEPVAEQRLYIPAAGIALLLGSFNVPLVMWASVVFCFATETFIRSWYWRSGIDLWMSVVRDGGRQDYALINVAAHYMETGELKFAEAYCLQALEINPNLADARANLAVIAHKRGQTQKSMELIRETVTRCPRYFRGWWFMGFFLCEPLGMVDEAVEAYEKCLAIKPWPHAANRLGLLWIHRGNFEMADKYFALAVQEDPNTIAYRYNHAVMLGAAGKQDAAIEQWKQLPKQIVGNQDMVTVSQ